MKQISPTEPGAGFIKQREPEEIRRIERKLEELKRKNPKSWKPNTGKKVLKKVDAGEELSGWEEAILAIESFSRANGITFEDMIRGVPLRRKTEDDFQVAHSLGFFTGQVARLAKLKSDTLYYFYEAIAYAYLVEGNYREARAIIVGGKETPKDPFKYSMEALDCLTKSLKSAQIHYLTYSFTFHILGYPTASDEIQKVYEGTGIVLGKVYSAIVQYFEVVEMDEAERVETIEMASKFFLSVDEEEGALGKAGKVKMPCIYPTTNEVMAMLEEVEVERLPFINTATWINKLTELMDEREKNAQQ